MCITEDKLVESYGKATPRERFRLIDKNYSIFPQLLDCYETGLFNRILFEVEEILLHKAAKDAFGLLEGGVPKLKALNQEYSELLKKKKDGYTEYRRIKEENKELQIAKHNLERFLNQQEEEQKQQSKSGQSR